MKVAIMQPYFFPYVGYFALVKAVDRFIIFDTPQYDRKGWMNRNRILNPSNDWQYINAGVVKPRFGSSIRDVKLKENTEWKKKLFSQLKHYKKIAPFYSDVISILESVLTPDYCTLVELNVASLKAVCSVVGIHTPIEVFSDLHLSINSVPHAGAWALEISRSLAAKTYTNPINGRKIFEPQEFTSEGICLNFLKHKLPEYSQGYRPFISGLSIVDVLMFNKPKETLEIICDYELVL
jgi:hypothetical protein